MRVIELDAKNWRMVLDFYDALLAALGAPTGHGYSVAALIDSMVWGGMNAVEAPYTIQVSGTEKLSREILVEINEIKQALVRACAERRASGRGDVEIGFEIAS
jgi:hypothetical protein